MERKYFDERMRLVCYGHYMIGQGDLCSTLVEKWNERTVAGVGLMSNLTEVHWFVST